MIELSIVLPVRNEQDNLALLLPRLHAVLGSMGLRYEILVIDGHSADGSSAVAQQLGAIALHQDGEGYGPALTQGFRAASGKYILTLDADLSHEPHFIHKLWSKRDRGEIIIASRYCTGGVAYAPLARRVLSRMLNAFFRWGLAVPTMDLSSGFRLYRAAVIKNMEFESKSFEVLEEIFIRVYNEGWRIVEIPFTYFPRNRGTSNARVIRFGLRLLRTFFQMWYMRNSIESADYDERAFYSRIPLQRYWHRKRHQIIMKLVRGRGLTLDVGCGSSVTTLSLNRGVGLDKQFNKLRYMAKYGLPLLNATATALPLAAQSFDCALCSQVFPFVPSQEEAMKEILRVLKPGGLLVIVIPDHSTIGWRIIEPLYRLVAPCGYGNHPQTRCTREDLEDLARRFKLIAEEKHYVLGSELIMSFLKPMSNQERG